MLQTEKQRIDFSNYYRLSGCEVYEKDEKNIRRGVKWPGWRKLDCGRGIYTRRPGDMEGYARVRGQIVRVSRRIDPNGDYDCWFVECPVNVEPLHFVA